MMSENSAAMSDDDSKESSVKGKLTARLVYDDLTHEETTLARLNTMRKGGHLCDVTIEIDGHCIPVHAAVVASNSVYLFELFSSKADQRSKHHFKLDNIDYNSFEVLINYAYTSRLECDGDLVKAVYKTAHILKMHRATEECANFLAENLTPQNCLGIYATANNGDHELTSRTRAYIQENLPAVLERSHELHRLPAILVDIVGAEPSDLQTGGEKALCKLVVDWLELAMEERPLERLVENTHILYLSSDNNLRDCLDDLSDVSTLNECDVVRDYKKLGKRKQMLPLKVKDKDFKGSRTPARSPTPGTPSISGHPSTDSLTSLAGGDWGVVAAMSVGDKKSFMCIAMLGESMASISIKFRTPPSSSSKQNGVNGGVIGVSCAGNGTSAVEVCVRAPTPTEERQGSLSPSDKQCLLTPLARMSSARCGLGTTVLNGCLIALGGYDRGECLNAVETFSLGSNSWKPIKPMLTARGRFSVAQMDERLYACGGSDGQTELNSVECYDPDTQTWTSIADMKNRRSSAGLAVCDGRLYVVGGWSGVGGRSTCEVYCPETNEWKTVAELNIGRSQVAVCALNGCLLAVGGCDAWNCTNTVEKYDPVADKWTLVAPMFNARRGAGIAVFKNKVYAVGGSDGQTSLVSVEIYDPVHDSWSFGPTLSTPRANTGVAVVDGRLWAVGGFSGKSFLDSVEYLCEDSTQWCSYVPPLASIKRGNSSEDVSAKPVPVVSQNGSVPTIDNPAGVSKDDCTNCLNSSKDSFTGANRKALNGDVFCVNDTDAIDNYVAANGISTKHSDVNGIDEINTDLNGINGVHSGLSEVNGI